MVSPNLKHLKPNCSNPAVGLQTAATHRCLFVSEILRLVFEFIWIWDGDPRKGDADEDPMGWMVWNRRRGSDGRKTLATLARTCRSFSGVALDFLWRDLSGFDPLLTICPNPKASTDETGWSSFRKYAERVRSVQIWGPHTRVPTSVKQALISSLERYPGDRLPIFPNLTEFRWRENTISGLDYSGVSLFKYFASPAVTTLRLYFFRSQIPPDSELAILSGLPNLCPNVTSLHVFFTCSRDCDLSRQVGTMASRWKRLQNLRSCVIPQSDMEKVASQRTLGTLGIEIVTSSPVHVGRLPDTVQKLLLFPGDAALGTRYLQHVHASPTICCLSIGMNHFDYPEIETLFQLLPCRLDRSRLERLTIEPRSVFLKTRLSKVPKLRRPLIQALTQFTSLRELDLDQFCASQLGDAEYAQMAESFPHLRHLKIGTAKLPSVVRPARPAATVIAVTTVLTYCPHLETLGVPFKVTVSRRSLLVQSISRSGELCHARLGDHEPGILGAAQCSGGVGEGWVVSNKRITTLHVGHSPLANANVSALASYLKSLMPNLKQIQHRGLYQGWDAVQNILTS